jgi:hypothetical protein
LDVQLFEESLVLVTCDEEVDWMAIVNGRAARILGKYYSGESDVFRAAVVFLGAREVSGVITAVSPATGGQDIIIETPEETPITVFVSDFTPVYLEEDGRVSNDFLCEGKEVRIPLDLYEPDPVAQRVMIQTEEVQGQVTSTPDDGDESRILFINGYTVDVQTNAEIVRCSDGEQEYIDLDDIQVGDQVRVFGLLDCEDETLFYGYTVQVMEYEQ